MKNIFSEQERWSQKEEELNARDAVSCLVDITRNFIDSPNSLLGFQLRLGAFQSDPIESRFGHYRQLSGANYFVSVKQLSENERKVKAMSLLRHSGISVEDLDLSCGQDKISNELEPLSSNDERLLSLVLTESENLPRPSLGDSNAIHYVTGASVRSEARPGRPKGCQSCCDILVDSEKQDSLMAVADTGKEGVESAVDDSVKQFVEMVSRGGLLYPSAAAYSFCLKAWEIFTYVKTSTEARELFLKSANQRKIFLAITAAVVVRDEDLMEVIEGRIHCEFGHDCLKNLAGRFFNSMMKNLARELSASSNLEKNEKRILKLSSKNKSTAMKK